jgi:hypothetical protein
MQPYYTNLNTNYCGEELAILKGNATVVVPVDATPARVTRSRSRITSEAGLVSTELVDIRSVGHMGAVPHVQLSSVADRTTTTREMKTSRDEVRSSVALSRAQRSQRAAARRTPSREERDTATALAAVAAISSQQATAPVIVVLQQY